VEGMAGPANCLPLQCHSHCFLFLVLPAFFLFSLRGHVLIRPGKRQIGEKGVKESLSHLKEDLSMERKIMGEHSFCVVIHKMRFGQNEVPERPF
jgi:hypothetical protein